MNNWTIARRLTLGFACTTLITVALGSFAWWRFDGLRKDIGDIAGDSLPAILNLTECMSLGKDNIIDLYEHVATETDERMSLQEQQIAVRVAR